MPSKVGVPGNKGRKEGHVTKGMEGAVIKNKPGLRLEYAEGFRLLLSTLEEIERLRPVLAVLGQDVPGSGSKSEAKAVEYILKCARYLEQEQTINRVKTRRKQHTDARKKAGKPVGMGTGRGRPKKNQGV